LQHGKLVAQDENLSSALSQRARSTTQLIAVTTI